MIRSIFRWLAGPCPVCTARERDAQAYLDAAYAEPNIEGAPGGIVLKKAAAAIDREDAQRGHVTHLTPFSRRRMRKP